MIGRVLSGRYEIQAVVGTGGMAVVYRAWDKNQKAHRRRQGPAPGIRAGRGICAPFQPRSRGRGQDVA